MKKAEIIATNSYINITNFCYGVDDYVKLDNGRKYKLYFAPKKYYYFRLNNKRYYLDDFMKV